jgi:DNA replication protein DnaC
LGYEACLQGHAVLFARAMDGIHPLVTAKSAGRLKAEINKYATPPVLIVAAIGSLPIETRGAA